MKWKRNEPALGTTEIRVEFLWAPVYFSNVVRWLENARVKYEFKEEVRSYRGQRYLYRGWVKMGVLNEGVV